MVELVKALRWADDMERLLLAGYIWAKEAERLAGRLNFAAGAVSGRSGAARIRYIYHPATIVGCKVVAPARDELQWWIRYLRMGRRHRFQLDTVVLPVAFL